MPTVPPRDIFCRRDPVGGLQGHTPGDRDRGGGTHIPTSLGGNSRAKTSGLGELTSQCTRCKDQPGLCPPLQGQWRRSAKSHSISARSLLVILVRDTELPDSVGPLILRKQGRHCSVHTRSTSMEALQPEQLSQTCSPGRINWYLAGPGYNFR